VKGFLGEGGRKRVYLAHDEKLDRDVAIAVIKTEGLDEAGLSRVKREAQAMARLGDHPNIVTVFDIGEEGPSAGSGRAEPYIVSQYMAGGDVEGSIRQAEDHRLPVERALRIAEQACHALEHAHARGVIHRDIKPGNIWLTEEGAAKLGDFGLAVALDRSRLTMEGTMLGTVAYMAPEQALGRQSDARSDLYSLGCVLYEMLTGRPPFLGEEAVGVISQHINTAPVALTWHSPEVPPELDALVMRLLAKVQDERPASAAAVAAALAAILVDAARPAAERPAAATAAGAQAGAFRRGPFAGREKEMAQLKERFEDALSGHGSLVMIVGEPGIGKTRLADELSVYARVRGAQALTGQCYESEGAPPYIPFVEALRQYVNSRPADALREEMGEGASDLAKLVSEVRARVPDIPSTREQEPEAERYRLLDAVASFLVNASTANPLLLILDDLHWADKPSLLLLEHLTRRLEGARILVLGTYRDVELDRRHPLSEVIAGLRRERLYERILLRGLDADGVRAMLAGRGAMSGRPEQYVNPALADALHQQTEGNPFFIEETILHLVAVGALYRKEGQWQIRMSALAEHIPEGVREVIGRRLSRLSEAANEALGHASVLGREFDFDVLQQFCEMGEDKLLSALEETLAAALVTEQKTASGVSYRFSHALVQETLYGELSIARKQRLHLRAGRALEQARAGRLEPHVGHLAYHFHQGNDAEKATEYSRQAGDAAARVYAWEEALRHWETALELMEEQGGNDEERARLLERLGDVIYLSGIGYEKGAVFLERALAIYEKLGARGKVAAMHSRLGRNMVSFVSLGLDLKSGVAHLDAARLILEVEAPDSPGLAYVYIGLASAYLYMLDIEKGLACARRGLEIGEGLDSAPVTANAGIFVGHFLAHSGRLAEGLLAIEKAQALASEHKLAWVSWLAGGFLAAWHGFSLRDPQTGRRCLEAELERPAVAAAPVQRDFLVGNLGSMLVSQGEIARAREVLESLPSVSGPFRSRLLIADGDWDRAETGIRGVAEDNRGSSNRMLFRGPAEALAELLLTAGRYEEAEELFRAVIALDENAGIRAWSLRPRVAMAQLLAATGRVAEAHEHLDWVAALLAEGEDWRGAAGLVALGRGVVAAAEQNWSEADEAFDEALAIARQYGLPWDEADALHERALMHIARGEKDDRKEALRLLDDAIAIYQRLGAKKHLDLVLADKLKVQGVSSSDIQTSIEAVAASVQAEQPDLRPHAAPDGTVTIMFSDIEGSTVLTERLGDKAWMAVLKEHNAIVREQVKAHGGFEVKSEGDGFMVAFGSARRALDCAMEIQKALAERNNAVGAPDTGPPGLLGEAGGAVGGAAPRGVAGGEAIRVRMGLHTGETIKEGADFFGKNVILAARIAAQAKGGEILVSGLLKALVDSAGDITFGEGREVALKGLSGEYEIWAVEWEAGR